MSDDERHEADDDAAELEATDSPDSPETTDSHEAPEASDATDSTEASDAPSQPADAPSGEDATSDRLREQLAQMREEADRIGELGTGTEQVEAAERFAEAAGRMDEQIGAAARDADDDRS